ncbi:hypothetical protein BE20_04115 [Sorangium cellulosum]|nr:hypothetical protein BE20_04115 [Sorangium cellulosum]
MACERGLRWLHVGFELHLASFYRGAGFAPTEAGLMKLGDDGQPEALFGGQASEAVQQRLERGAPPSRGGAGRSGSGLRSVSSEVWIDPDPLARGSKRASEALRFGLRPPREGARAGRDVAKRASEALRFGFDPPSEGCR